MRFERRLQKIIIAGFLTFSVLLFSQIEALSNTFEKVDLTNCEADFSFSEYDGPMPVLGGITFQNLSTGNFSYVSWDFGDGTTNSYDIGEEVTHFYSEGGSYTVSLMIWETGTNECFSSTTKTIEVWISDDPCEQLDCVWPGDTNGDGSANVEDVLNIGLEFGATGPARDSICGGWFGHLAEDWEEYTIDGVDLKHGDCNGDGEINLSDLPFTSNVSGSYSKLENGISNTNSNGPQIKMQFNVDTVRITDLSKKTTIDASLELGSSTTPMEDVYGVVLYLEYPNMYVDSNVQIVVDYDNNSFFGTAGEVIPRSVDIKEEGQIDFAITRRNGQNTSGYGRIATVSFIIDADIIDGRDEDEGTSFNVDVKVVKVIDKLGNDIDVNLSPEPSSVFFVNKVTTSTVDPVLSDKVNVFPNPVSDVLNIELGELKGEILELYDILGKRVVYRELNSEQLINMNVNRLEKGMYVLKIQTDQGLVSKRIVVE